MSERSNNRRASLALGLCSALAFAMATSGAYAQAPAAKPAPAKPAAPAATPAKPAAPAPAAAAAAAPTQDLAPGETNPWIKICSKDAAAKNVCLTAQELRGQDGRVIASVALREIEGDAQKTLLIAVPPMVLIQPGLKLVVDKGKPEDGKYMICYPNSCFAEAPISTALYNSLRTGGVLTIVTMSAQNNKQMGLPIKLAGFKVSNDGPGIDPATGQAQEGSAAPGNADFLKAAEKRAEQERLKLQGGAATPPKP